MLNSSSLVDGELVVEVDCKSCRYKLPLCLFRNFETSEMFCGQQIGQGMGRNRVVITVTIATGWQPHKGGLEANIGLY